MIVGWQEYHHYRNINGYNSYNDNNDFYNGDYSSVNGKADDALRNNNSKGKSNGISTVALFAKIVLILTMTIIEMMTGSR